MTRKPYGAYKKHLAIEIACNVLSHQGNRWGEALETVEEMKTRQLYKFLNDNGWVWSVSFDKWVRETTQ